MTPKLSERIEAEATELMQGSEIATLRFGGKWGEFMEGKAALLRALAAEVAAMEGVANAAMAYYRDRERGGPVDCPSYAAMFAACDEAARAMEEG